MVLLSAEAADEKAVDGQTGTATKESLVMLSSWAAAWWENSQARRWSSGFSPHTII